MREEIKLQARLHGIEIAGESNEKSAPELTASQKAALDKRLSEIQSKVRRGE